MRTSTGTTVYPDASSNADVAIQTLPTGMRILVVIHNANAPHEYRFPLTLPAGARLVGLPELIGDIDLDTQELFILDAEGKPVGYIAAPWAKDAHGNAVPTSYRVEGSTLIQHVNFTAQTAFPVVADPTPSEIGLCAAAIGGFILMTALPVGRAGRAAWALGVLVRKYGVNRVASAIMGVRRANDRTFENDLREFVMQASGLGLLAACGL